MAQKIELLERYSNVTDKDKSKARIDFIIAKEQEQSFKTLMQRPRHESNKAITSIPIRDHASDIGSNVGLTASNAPRAKSIFEGA